MSAQVSASTDHDGCWLTRTIINIGMLGFTHHIDTYRYVLHSLYYLPPDIGILGGLYKLLQIGSTMVF